MTAPKITKATPKPWSIVAGTIIKDVDGKTLLYACEEGEGRGGDCYSIRQTIIEAVEAVNQYPALLAVAEAAQKYLSLTYPIGLPSGPEASLIAALAAMRQARGEKEAE